VSQPATRQTDDEETAQVRETRTGVSSAPIWALALASLGSFMVALEGLVVTTALTAIRLDLDASVAELEWTVNAFTVSFAVLIMTGAALGDRFGRRRVFVAGLGVFTAASAACAVAPDVGSLIAARAVQGVGAALVTPLALALVSAAFPPERRGWALGIFSGAIGLAVLCGPVVGGAITEGIAWQWIFWLNIPVGLLAIPLVLRRVPESFGPRTTLDVTGVALISAAALGLVWGLVRGNSAGWGSVEVVSTLTAGAALTALFIGWELRVREPMLPMRLFRSAAFSAGNAVSFFLFASNLSAVYFLAQFQQETLGQGPLDAGLRLLPLTVAFFIGAPRAGALADRIGERPLIVIGLLLLAAGSAWLALIAQPGLAYAAMIAPLILAGAGTAMAMPAAQKAVVGAVAPSEIGKASGTFSTMRWLGGTFGVALAVALFAALGGYGSPHQFSDGFSAAMSVSAGLSLAGAIAAAALPSRRRATESDRGASSASPALDTDSG
jgi:EmrB/QacA subfamily drug resistance transporter